MESISYLFAVPKDYELDVSKFKRRFKKHQISFNHTIQLTDSMISMASNIVSLLADGGGFFHCQDADWEIWTPLMGILTEDLYVVYEFTDGSNSANDSVMSLSDKDLSEIICTMVPLENTLNLVNR